MIPMSIRELAEIMNGTAYGDALVSADSRFQFDSRAIKSGDVFLA